MTTPNPSTTPNTPATPTSSPFRPGGGPWPGTRPWTDDDYRQFVDLYDRGAFPELSTDPTAWDEHYRCCGDKHCYHGERCRDGNFPQCPRQISIDDFDKYITTYRDSHGLLALKLWHVARGKGFTAESEARDRRHHEEQARKQAEQFRQQARREADALRQNLPTPTPMKMSDLRQRWYREVTQSVPQETPLVEKVKHVQSAAIQGQPYRSAVLARAGNPPDSDNDTFGPLTLDGTPDALADPFEPTEETPVPRKWAADATTEEILNGSARDLSDLICVLIARQKTAIGYAPDKDTIDQTIRLSRALCNLTQTARTTQLMQQSHKRGRPKKDRPHPASRQQNK